MTSCIEWLYRMVVQWLYRSGGRKGLMLLQLRGAPGASPVGVTLGGLGLGTVEAGSIHPLALPWVAG